jgi:capsular exopolysaccharide synthesis family protein
LSNPIQHKDSVNEFIDNFNLKLFLFISKKSIAFIIILGFISILIPFLYIRYSNPIFETNASLIRKKGNEENNILSKEMNSVVKNDDETKINRDIQLIKSDILIDKTIESYELNYELYKNGFLPFKKFEIYPVSNELNIKNTQVKNSLLYGKDITLNFEEKTYDISYSINGELISREKLKYGKTFENKDLSINITPFTSKTEGKYTFKFNNHDAIKSYIQQLINVELGQNQNIILYSRTHNTAKSISIMNQLIQNFLEYDKNENQEKIEKSLTYIDQQLQIFKDEYWKNEREFTSFKQSNLMYEPTGQLTEYLENIKKLNDSKLELENQIKELNRLKGNSKSKLSNNIMESSDLADEISEIQTLVDEKNNLLLDYKPTHPAIKLIENKLNFAIEFSKNKIGKKIQNNEDKIFSLRQKLNEIKGDLNAFPNLNSQFSHLEKESQIKEKFIFDLLDKQNQFLVSKSSIISDYIVLQPPKVKSEIISPKKNLLYTSSIFIFVLASLILVIIRYILFDKIVSMKYIQMNTNVPILGMIPFVEDAQDHSEKTKSSPTTKIVVNSGSKSKISEAFKKMRANMKYIHSSDFQTVAATSTISGEGKTFILSNLAVVYAQLNKKVVIIDLDLRKPRIAKSFKLNNSLGMSTILSNNSDIESAIQHLPSVDNIDVITSGPIPPNPSELILSARFNEVLEYLKTKYDYVFIDTPPVGLVNESIEIINKVDIPIYVVRANYSKMEFLSNLNEIHHQFNDKKLYLVVNQFGVGASYYLNNSYGYGYGYGSYGKEYTEKHDGYYTEKVVKKSPKSRFKKFFDWKL